MPVMAIGEMQMPVTHRCMGVRMVVGLLSIPCKVVGMSVMLVMDMGMSMTRCLVLVRVLVALGQVQPCAQCHQRASDD